MNTEVAISDSMEPLIDPVAVGQQIRKMISEQTGIRSDDIKDSAVFVNDLGVDSLDMVEIVMAIEEDFDIQISDDDVGAFQTVRHMIDRVLALASAAPATNS